MRDRGREKDKDERAHGEERHSKHRHSHEHFFDRPAAPAESAIAVQPLPAENPQLSHLLSQLNAGINNLVQELRRYNDTAEKIINDQKTAQTKEEEAAKRRLNECRMYS